MRPRGKPPLVEVAQATDPSKGAHKLKQDRQPWNGEPPARNSKPLNTKQRANAANTKQNIDQVKEDYNQSGRYNGDPYVSNCLPSTLGQQAEQRMALVDGAVAELLVMHEDWVRDYQRAIQQTNIRSCAP